MPDARKIKSLLAEHRDLPSVEDFIKILIDSPNWTGKPGAIEKSMKL